MQYFRFSALAFFPAIAFLSAVPAVAATVGAGVNVIFDGSAVSMQDNVDDTAAQGRRAVSAAAGSGAAQASAHGNIETGAMDATLLDIDGDAQVEISTNFTAHGSGQIDFTFNTSASWSGANPGSTFFETHLVAGDGFLEDSYEGNPGPAFQASGALNRRLSYTATVADGATYYLAATVFASLFVDGPSSAAISGDLTYAPSAGVSLAFDDPRFLAAPVPLPPTGLLLGAGLIGLGLLGWRRT